MLLIIAEIEALNFFDPWFQYSALSLRYSKPYMFTLTAHAKYVQADYDLGNLNCSSRLRKLLPVTLLLLTRLPLWRGWMQMTLAEATLFIFLSFWLFPIWADSYSAYDNTMTRKIRRVFSMVCFFICHALPIWLIQLKWFVMAKSLRAVVLVWLATVHALSAETREPSYLRCLLVSVWWWQRWSTLRHFLLSSFQLSSTT